MATKSTELTGTPFRGLTRRARASPVKTEPTRTRSKIFGDVTRVAASAGLRVQVMLFSFYFAVHFGVVEKIQSLRIASRRAEFDPASSHVTGRGRQFTAGRR